MRLGRLRTAFAGLPGPVQRLAMLLVVVALYYGLWRPMRVAFVQTWAYPSFAEAAIPGVRLVPHPTAVEAYAAGRPDRLIYKSPSGDRTFLGMLAFAFLFPRRPYWAWLWGVNLVLGLVATWFFYLGVGGADWGFAAFSIVQGAFVDTLSLAVPPLLYLLDRSGYVRLSPQVS